jgi:hypothetical protein
MRGDEIIFFLTQSTPNLRGVGFEPTRIAPKDLKTFALTTRPSSLKEIRVHQRIFTISFDFAVRTLPYSTHNLNTANPTIQFLVTAHFGLIR